MPPTLLRVIVTYRAAMSPHVRQQTYNASGIIAAMAIMQREASKPQARCIELVGTIETWNRQGSTGPMDKIP